MIYLLTLKVTISEIIPKINVEETFIKLKVHLFPLYVVSSNCLKNPNIYSKHSLTCI